MEENENIDPWDLQPFYNLNGEPEDIRQYITGSSPSSINESGLKKLQASIENLREKDLIVTVSKPILSMKERYQLAWTLVFKKQPEWRQEEITETQKNGTFGSKHYDDDFVRQVALLAESDDPLRA